jgi:hypothetical protein
MSKLVWIKAELSDPALQKQADAITKMEAELKERKALLRPKLLAYLGPKIETPKGTMMVFGYEHGFAFAFAEARTRSEKMKF